MVHVFCNLEETDDGLPPMCDMTFNIAQKRFDEAASSWRLWFHADATPFDPVGFGAVIPVSGWQEQVDGEGDDAFHSFWGPVSLHSKGHESDRLLALIADYYGIKAPPDRRRWLSKLFSGRVGALATTWKFADRIDCFAVGIASNPASLANDATRMKLFFDQGIENGRYAEVFLDIDLPRGLATLNEKDEEYRADLIHWLSLPGNVMANPYSKGH